MRSAEYTATAKASTAKDAKNAKDGKGWFFGKKGLAFFAFGVYPPRRAFFAVDAVALPFAD